MKILLTIFILTFSFSLFAQIEKKDVPKGKVLIYVSKSEAIIKIDSGIKVEQNTLLTLDTGIHQIKVFGPKLKTISNTFRVYGDSIIRVKERVKFNDEWRTYKNQTYKHYTLLSAKILLPLAMGFTTYYYFNKFSNEKNNYYKKAEENIIQYENSINQQEIDKIKSDFKENKSQYKKYEKLQYVALSGSIITLATVFILNYTKKAPKYTEPTLLTGFKIRLKTVKSLSILYSFN